MFEPFGEIKLKIVHELIAKSNPEDKILIDLGSGKPAISDGVKCKKRIKIDISPETEPDIVHNFTEGIPLPDSSVDICLAIEIIEHLYYSKRFVSEINRVLVPGGMLILTTPNIVNLRYRIAFMFGHIPALAAKGDMFYKDDRYGHIRDYNFKELTGLLKSHSFEIVDKKTDGVSVLSRTIIPKFIIPVTFGDAIIVRAKCIKKK